MAISVRRPDSAHPQCNHPKNFTAKPAKIAKTRQFSLIQERIRSEILRAVHSSDTRQRFEFVMFLCGLCAICEFCDETFGFIYLRLLGIAASIMSLGGIARSTVSSDPPWTGYL